MSEKMNEPEQLPSGYRITQLALKEVEHLYGTGYPEYEMGSYRSLPYHNLSHTLDVVAATVEMANRLGLNDKEKTIAVMASAAHDFVQVAPYEIGAAQWLVIQMQQEGDDFSEEDIDVARLAILGTEPLYTGKKITGQKVNLQEYPSESAEVVAKIVACADFSQLYSPKGPLLAHDLYREQKGLEAGEEPDLNGLSEFQSNYIDLLEAYTYPLGIGEDIFTALKTETIEYAWQFLYDMQTDDVGTWQDVVYRDVDFLQRHSLVE